MKKTDFILSKKSKNCTAGDSFHLYFEDSCSKQDILYFPFCTLLNLKSYIKLIHDKATVSK